MAVQLNGVAHHGRVAAEAVFPGTVTQNYHGIAQGHAVLRWTECTTKRGLNAKQRKVWLRNVLAGNALGCVDASQRKLIVGKGGHGLKRSSLAAPVDIVRIRGAAPLDPGALDVAPQDRQTPRMGIGQRTKDGRIHYAEYGR